MGAQDGVTARVHPTRVIEARIAADLHASGWSGLSRGPVPAGAYARLAELVRRAAQARATADITWQQPTGVKNRIARGPVKSQESSRVKAAALARTTAVPWKASFDCVPAWPWHHRSRVGRLPLGARPRVGKLPLHSPAQDSRHRRLPATRGAGADHLGGPGRRSRGAASPARLAGGNREPPARPIRGKGGSYARRRRRHRWPAACPPG